MSALMLAVPLGTPALAVPLDAPACEQLQAEFDTLKNEGAAADLARGPDWARANLPLGGLQRVQKYIEVEEQLNFRCGLAKTRITLPTTIEGGEEEIPAPGEAASGSAPGGVALPQRAPSSGQKRPANAAAAVTVVPKTPAQAAPVQKAAPQKAPAPKAAPAAASAKAKSSEKAAAAPKAKPKSTAESTPPAKKKAPAQTSTKQPQVDDAYRPPARPMTSDQNRAPPPARQ